MVHHLVRLASSSAVGLLLLQKVQNRAAERLDACWKDAETMW